MPLAYVIVDIDVTDPDRYAADVEARAVRDGAAHGSFIAVEGTGA